jgi:alginate O-acetyltransferase complex protein AlgJ
MHIIPVREVRWGMRHAGQLAFLLIISVPLVLTCVDAASPALDQAHAAGEIGIANRFQLIVKSTKAGFSHFRRNFGGRDMLMRCYSSFNVGVLGISWSDHVIIGRNNWLFFAGHGDVATRYRRLFSTTELSAWKTYLEKRRDMLAERNIPYLFIVAPDKQSVFRSELPLSICYARAPSRLDQLMAYMRLHSSVDILDVRKILIEGNAVRPTYHRTDSHWNDWGALLAYSAITERMGSRVSGIKPLLESDFLIVTNRSGGDLSRWLWAENFCVEDQIRLVRKMKPAFVYEKGTRRDPTPSVVGERIESRFPGAPISCGILLCDSFGASLVPFLAEHFDRGLYIRSWDIDFNVVGEDRPCVVIEEMVERKLDYVMPGEEENSTVFDTVGAVQ